MTNLEKLLEERGFLFLSDVYEALGFGSTGACTNADDK